MNLWIHLSEASFTLNWVNSISFTNHLGHFHTFKWDVDPQVFNHKFHLGDLGDVGVGASLRGDLNSGWEPMLRNQVPSHVPELKICGSAFSKNQQSTSTQEPLTSHWAPSPRLWIPHAWTPQAPESTCRHVDSGVGNVFHKIRWKYLGNGELWENLFGDCCGLTHPLCGTMQLPHQRRRGSCCANQYHPGKRWFNPWRTNISAKFLCKNAKSQQLCHNVSTKSRCIEGCWSPSF